MRTWIVGLACAFLGGYVAYASAIDGRWLFALGGVAMLIAALNYIFRPGLRSTGLLEVCWGLLIVAHGLRSLETLSYDPPSAGRFIGFVVGGVLIVVGLVHWIRPTRPLPNGPS